MRLVGELHTNAELCRDMADSAKSGGPSFYLRRLARRSISAPDSDFGGEGGVYTEFRSLRSHFGQRMDFLVSIVNI